MNIVKELQHILGFISTFRILGFIPLGMILHISISAVLTIVLLKLKIKFRNVCLIVFAIGLSKELLDCFVINNTWQKHVLDMCYNMSFPATLYLIRKLKTKKQSTL